MIDPLAKRSETALLGGSLVGSGIHDELLRRYLAVDAVGRAVFLLLDRQNALHATLCFREPLAAALDDVAHRVEREEGALFLLFLEDDLRERDRRQILFCFVIYDFYVV